MVRKAVPDNKKVEKYSCIEILETKKQKNCVSMISKAIDVLSFSVGKLTKSDKYGIGKSGKNPE